MIIMLTCFFSATSTIRVTGVPTTKSGLAFLIETGKQRILFDTGQYLALKNNARVLGKDLATIDMVVLSHGHYDHTGGLRHLLECNAAFSLYAHPDVFARKLIKRKGQYRKVGIPVPKDALVKKGVALNLNTGPVALTPEIMTSGEIPLASAFETVAEGFFVEKDGRMVPDTLADDQALILTLALWLSKGIRRAITRVGERRGAVNQSSLYTFGRLVHYLVLTIGIIIGLSSIGIDFTKFALFASALGVGIGFGLQSIVNNFVSGLIILFEKSLKVGDFVDRQGAPATAGSMPIARVTTLRSGWWAASSGVIVPASTRPAATTLVRMYRAFSSASSRLSSLTSEVLSDDHRFSQRPWWALTARATKECRTRAKSQMLPCGSVKTACQWLLTTV